MAGPPTHHHHQHGTAELSKSAFALATGLNAVFVVVEFVAGWLADSVALTADAVHNLGDVAGLALAWGAAALARRPPTSVRTYGLGKATVLAGMGNAVLVFVAVGGVCWAALMRLFEPPEVQAVSVIVVAAIGLVVNFLAAALFVKARHDINARGAFVHLAADGAVSGAVVVAGIVLMFTDWHWLDPAISLAICVVVGWMAWSLLRDSVNLAMDGVPPHVDLAAIENHLRTIEGVSSVHDLHVWPMSASETALTAHLIMPDDADRAEVLHRIDEDMQQTFGICHCTIQIEPSGHSCEGCAPAAATAGAPPP